MSEAAPPSPLAPETSPLGEADPSSLNELISSRIDDIFNKKPSLMTDEDLTVMVEYYQRERLRFMQESATKELKPKATRRSATAPKSVADAIARVNAEDLL